MAVRAATLLTLLTVTVIVVARVITLFGVSYQLKAPYFAAGLAMLVAVIGASRAVTQPRSGVQAVVEATVIPTCTAAWVGAYLGQHVDLALWVIGLPLVWIGGLITASCNEQARRSEALGDSARAEETACRDMMAKLGEGTRYSRPIIRRESELLGVCAFAPIGVVAVFAWGGLLSLSPGDTFGLLNWLGIELLLAVVYVGVWLLTATGPSWARWVTRALILGPFAALVPMAAWVGLQRSFLAATFAVLIIAASLIPIGVLVLTWGKQAGDDHDGLRGELLTLIARQYFGWRLRRTELAGRWAGQTGGGHY
jgi:hypothetical protein